MPLRLIALKGAVAETGINPLLTASENMETASVYSVTLEHDEWRPPEDVPEPGAPQEEPPSEPETPPAPPAEEPPAPDEVPGAPPPESIAA